MSLLRYPYLFLTGLLLVGLTAHGQAPLDPNFGEAGKLRLSPDTYNQTVDLMTTKDGDVLLMSATGGVDVFFDLDVLITKIQGSPAPFRMSGALDQYFGDEGQLRFDFGDMDHSLADEIVELNDGSFMVLGSGYRWDSTLYLPACLTHITEYGEIDTTFGDSGTLILEFYGVQEFPNSIEVDPKGRVIVSGSTLDTLHGHSNAMSIGRFLPTGEPDSTFAETGRMLINLDSGITILRHTAGGIIYDVLCLDNGQLLVSGGASNGSHLECFFLRMNEDGTVDSSFHDEGYLRMNLSPGYNCQIIKLEETPDGRVLFGANSFTDFDRDFLIGLIDPVTGEVQLDSIDFDGNQDLLADILLTPEGGIIAVGNSTLTDNISSTYRSDFLATAYIPDYRDMSTRFLHTERFELGFQSGAQAALVLGDRVINSGFTYSETVGGIDLALIALRLDKLNPPFIPPDYEELIVYPNPATDDRINVQITRDQGGELELMVYDVTGRVVRYMTGLGPGSHSFSAKGLQTGSYVVALYRGEDLINHRRLIVE